MRRRDFLALAGAAATPSLWPFAARAQRPGRLPTIGVLGSGSASAWREWVGAFAVRLRELGWVEGRTVAIEYRWAEGRPERYAEIATEFSRLKVDVMVTSGVSVPAAKAAAPDTPIVFAIAADPVGSGLVASLARPGGTVTGLSLQQTEAAGKRLELLREVIPDFRRLAIIANAGAASAVLDRDEAIAAASKLGLDVVDRLDVRKPDDIAPAFAALKGGAQALYVCGDGLINANRSRINLLAVGARMLTIWPNRYSLEGGGFISYGVDNADLFRRAAEMVDKILRGTKPADIPVEQPTKFELVINLTAAKALGLKIPEAFLLRADEVIE